MDTMMKLIILDPGLTELSGHHFNYNSYIFKECKVRGIGLTIFSHAACDESVADVLPIRRCFDVNTYDCQTVVTQEDMKYKFSTFNNMMEVNLLETVDIQFDPEDIIIMITATVFQIVGVLNWYSTLPVERPRICIQFMHQPWYLGLESDPDYCTSLLRHAMGAWADQSDLRITFAADQDVLGNFLHEVSGFPIRILPMPIDYPPLPIGESPIGEGKAGTGRLRIGFLGDGRPEKGLHHLVRAIIDQKDDPLPNVDFFIHISNQQGRIAYDLLKDVPNCTVVCKQFTGAEYWETARSCDVIVLPYDPKYYHIRGSGILFEAMGLGKPIVVTSGSCLDWLAAKYNGAAVRCGFASESLLEAIRIIAGNFADFEEIAQISAAQVRAIHNPKSFFDALMRE
jgi:glycosyltransferase involved in cell wall biosynthesis